MGLKVFELKNGDVLLIDGEHPHEEVSRYVLEDTFGRDAFLRVGKYLQHQLEQVEVKRNQERAKTTDAEFERNAIFDFLRRETKHYFGIAASLGDYHPFDSLFEAMSKGLVHHRVKKGG